MYSYKKSIKSELADELINTYMLRPMAGVIVSTLYNTSVTPNQVTIASILVGFAAAAIYLLGTPTAILIAGLFVTLKDILDSADGQLARAKQQNSRIGRFLDSIGDFIVDAAVFAAIGWILFQQEHSLWMPVLAMLGLLGISLRVSYHVFYQTNYLHLQNHYTTNRVTEELREEDLQKDQSEIVLQKIFQIIYGWQDRLMLRIDRWCMKHQLSDEQLRGWYADTTALRLSGLLGFGTELFLLMVCSVFGQLRLYLYLNLFLMNGIWLGCVIYRRMYLRNKVLHN